LDKMSTHDKLLIQIKLAKKCTTLTEQEQEEINKLENELKIKEQNNISLLQKNMAEVRVELDKLKFQNKLKKAYNQEYIPQEQGSIIDIEDSYRPQN